MTEQAGQVDAALRELVSWASWRLLAVVDTGAIAAARAQKAQLAAEVAEMQANRDERAKEGFMAKLARCEPKARPCGRVDEKVGPFGTAGDYRVLRGY